MYRYIKMDKLKKIFCFIIFGISIFLLDKYTFMKTIYFVGNALLFTIMLIYFILFCFYLFWKIIEYITQKLNTIN